MVGKQFQTNMKTRVALTHNYPGAMLDGLIPLHVQTVSDGSATCFAEVELCQCHGLFSRAIESPVSDMNTACWIAIRHQTVSGGDVNMCILP